MKLTKAYQQEIQNIIKKEMNVVKEGWIRSDASKKRSKIIEKRLFENSALGDLRGTAEALEDACVAGAGDAMNSFGTELYDHLASVLISHGVVSSRFTAKMLMEELADLENDSLVDAKMEATSVISGALAAYADSVALLVPRVVKMDGLEDEVESPDKLLPEF